MEGITSVKIEPLEDFEYNFQQEEKFEIKSEVDVQIKSEECFKEEFNDYQQPECWPGPTTLLPIKEELTSEIDLPIKSEEGFEEELNYYQQPECWSGPPIKGELPKRQESLTLSSPVEQCGSSLTKSNEGISDSVQTKIKRVKCSKYNEGEVTIKHGKTRAKRLCKQEGCAKWCLKGGKCITHGGTPYSRLCKEEGCAKRPLKGGRCTMHGGTPIVKHCNVEWCFKHALKGGKCMKHGGTKTNKTCKEEGCAKQAKWGGKCIKHNGTLA